MPTLLDTQRSFAASLFNPAAPWPETAVTARDLPPQRRMDVYRNNVFSSLIEALGALYPVVNRLVGAGFFAYAADTFLRAEPPRRGALIDFGAGFADFLAAFPPARDLAYLADVARLELAWHQAYHAADAEPLRPDHLSALPSETLPTLNLRPHPACRCLYSPFPVAAIWDAHQDPDVTDAIDVAAGPSRTLVTRPEAEVQVRVIGAGPWALLNAIVGGKALGLACEEALQTEPDFDARTAPAILIAAGAFAAPNDDDQPTETAP